MDMTLDQGRFATMRQAMVASQLRPNAVNDAAVVDAMAIVPRERYLPAALAAVAYSDAALPLGEGRIANPPIATGRLLTEARVRASDRVLVVGAAGGYAAAVLARLAARVTALEVSPTLHALAAEALAESGVALVAGPLAAGHAAGAPYDLIFVDGAIEQVPPALIEQLEIEGRLVTGINDRGVSRLCVGRRTPGGFGLADFADIEAAPLPGFARPPAFSF
ncbi:MAG: protein-L-isoaspartate O-methyltransferase [Proteobacteria bacterium SG_bin5]|nr:protein-L-isoaspartate O-methyltransferase [Sphingomonas sp.]OQW40364.1 MAG: protein-L-isoaspartate O-methyltransferase [Proteobacteria bacterium SG_bin5]